VTRIEDPPAGARSIDEILTAARSRLHRVEPVQAQAAHRAGAVLVDIRPAAQREATGEIPDAVVVERNVLEWRFDPRSDARLPIADRYDLPVVIFCQEGYTSSLAAAALQDLGLHRATDVIGGFTAWAAAGLPTTAPHPRGQRNFLDVGASWASGHPTIKEVD
jgi:rhodanese-related sulfurtransferase